MIQSSHRFGLAGSPPDLSEFSLARWAAVLGFAAITLGPFEAKQIGPQTTQQNWIQTNLAAKRRDQTGGLIESCTSFLATAPCRGYRYTTGKIVFRVFIFLLFGKAARTYKTLKWAMHQFDMLKIAL